MTKRSRTKRGDDCVQEMKLALSMIDSKKRKLETSGDEKETTFGNTGDSNVAQKPRQPQWKHMDLTWYGYKDGDMETLKSVMRPLCDVFVFQEEIGKKSGKPHIQGCFSLKKRSRFLEFGLPKETSWRKVRDLTKCREYCSKLDTRKPGTTPSTFNYEVPSERLIDPYYIYPDRPWQQDAIKRLSEPANTRTIHWYWSEKGNIGKSTLANHLIDYMRGRSIGGLSAANIYYHLCRIRQGLKHNDILVYDLARDDGNKLSYRALEKIKDRNLFSTKYECMDFKVPVMHIIVFANMPPMLEKLTADRWVILNIDKLEESSTVIPSLERGPNSGERG